MKILLMPASYPAPGNPVSGVFYHEQAQALSAKHNVAVFAPRQIGWWEPHKWAKAQRFSDSEYEGIRVFRSCGMKLAPMQALPGPMLKAYLADARRSLERVIDAWGEPDLIHAHVTVPAGWAAVKLGEELGIPVVVTEHSSGFASWMSKPGMRSAVEQGMHGADQVIAVSPSLKERIENALPRVDVTVVGNVVQTDRFVPIEAVKPTPVFRFLCIATLKKVKGVEYLIKAASKLRDRGMDHFEVYIGGDGPERDKLCNLAAQLDIGGKVQFLDLLDKNDVVDHVQSCDCLVAPSLLETFCVILAEAMSCGKPVISTKCGGPEWVVPDHAGVLVEPGNAVELADAMAAMISGRRKYDAAAIRQSIVDRFSPEKIVGELERVYEGIGLQAKRL